jgi:hypothetical protein
VPLDEQWSFVGKQQRHCDPADGADGLKGDQGDHVALDPDSRRGLQVVIGPRTAGGTRRLLEGVRDRLGGRVPDLITRDESPVYPDVVRAVFGEARVPPRTGPPGRPAGPRVVVPEDLCDATVHKPRERGRVPAVEARGVLGELGGGERVSTSDLERQNGTDRHRNARKGRKTYRFSKDWVVHEAVTCLTLYCDNVCWPVRALRPGDRAAGDVQRTPAMVAGLTDHVWSLDEWFTSPGVQR